MNILLMILLGLIASDMLLSAVQTEKWYTRQRSAGDLTANRIVALIYVVALIWAVAVIA